VQKIPHYRFMVCKGMQTIALTTTQREAEAESARVGGEVHELTPTRNPTDPDYSIFIDRGSFSGAYAKPDKDGAQKTRAHERTADRVTKLTEQRDALDKFFTKDYHTVDRGTASVETQTILPDRSPWDGSPGRIDAAKLIMWLARKSLKGDRAALAYLPNIRPVRLDLTGARPDLIFKMPIYASWRNVALKPEAKAVRAALSRDGADGDHGWTTPTDNEPLNKAATIFARNMQNHFGSYAHKEIEPVKRALLAIHEICKDLPMTKYGADAHGGNFAVDKNGHLILLDVFFSELPWEDVVELWKKLKLKVKATKGAKAPKAPKAKASKDKASKAKAPSVKFASVSKKAASKKAEKPVTLTKARLESIGKQIEQTYPPARVEVFDETNMDVRFPPDRAIVLHKKQENWAVSLFRISPTSGITLVKEKIFQSPGYALSELLVEVHLAYDQLAKPATVKPASVKKATTPKSAKAPATKKPASVKKATTPKPASVKKAATKKPRAAKAAKGPKKLEGKKLTKLLSDIYGKVFNKVMVGMFDISEIYREMEQAYKAAGDHEQGVQDVNRAAIAARAKYGNK